MKRSIFILAMAAALADLAGCAGVSEQQQRIGTGAVLGGVAGSVLSNGAAAGVVGGAAIGGLIGNAVDQNAQKQVQPADDRESRYRECRKYRSKYHCDYNIP